MEPEGHIPFMINDISTSQEPPVSSKLPAMSSIFEHVLDAFKLNWFQTIFEGVLDALNSLDFNQILMPLNSLDFNQILYTDPSGHVKTIHNINNINKDTSPSQQHHNYNQLQKEL